MQPCNYGGTHNVSLQQQAGRCRIDMHVLVALRPRQFSKPASVSSFSINADVMVTGVARTLAASG